MALDEGKDAFNFSINEHFLCIHYLSGSGLGTQYTKKKMKKFYFLKELIFY